MNYYDTVLEDRVGTVISWATVIGMAVFFLGICFILLLPFLGLRFKSAEGNHRGYITAVSTNNYFFDHTTDVWFKTELSSSQEDKYCIDNSEKELIDTAKKSVSEKKTVVILYDRIESGGFGKCTGWVITKIQAAE